MSHPLAGGVKVIQQTARLLGLLVNSMPVLSVVLYSSTLPPEASLYTKDTQILGVRAQEDGLDSRYYRI
jgi:hypothetical protein